MSESMPESTLEGPSEETLELVKQTIEDPLYPLHVESAVATTESNG